MLSFLKHSPVIRHIARRILEEPRPPPLGRWRLEHCNSEQTRQKIDLANEDHCGPCGQYALEQLEKRIETRIRDVEKKTDGINDFLTKV